MSSNVEVLSIAIEHVQRKIATVIVGSVLFGTFTLLFCLSAAILVRRGLLVWSYGFLFATTTAMYFIAATYWITELVTVLQTIYRPSAYAIQSVSSLENKSMVLTVCLGMNFWLSDVIILTRTLVLWKDNKLIQSISGLIFATITALCLADVITTRSELSAYANQVAQLPIAFKNSYGGAAIFLSLGFNVWVTALVSYRLWEYRKAVRQSQTSITGLTRQSLSLLMECGALYVVIWIVFIICSAYRQAEQSPAASYALDQAVVQVSGIYPTIIIVLVCLRKVREDNELLPVLSRRHRRRTMHDTSASAMSSANTVNQSSDESRTLENGIHIELNYKADEPGFVL